MVIKKKIDHPKEDSRNKIISRGGHVKADSDQSKKEWINFCLRIRVDLLEQIDKALEDRIGISKTAWILEAIQKHLNSDRRDSF